MFYLCPPTPKKPQKKPKPQKAVYTEGLTQIAKHIFLTCDKTQTCGYCDDKLAIKDSINMCTVIKRCIDLKKSTFKMVSMG